MANGIRLAIGPCHGGNVVLALHLAVLATPAKAGEPHLLVWGESDPPDVQAAPTLTGCGVHPLAAAHRAIWQGLVQWAPALAPHGETFLPEGWRHTACLFLPHGPEGPLRSAAMGGPEVTKDAALRPVAVAALRLHPGTLLPALAALSSGPPPEGMRAGAGFATMSLLYRAAVETWGRGAAWPDAGDEARPSRTPRWRAAPHHPDLLAAVAQAAATLPPAFWAAGYPGVTGPVRARKRDPYAITADLLDELTHALAVSWLRMPAAWRVPPGGLEHAFGALSRGLAGQPLPPGPVTPGHRTAVARLARWTAPVRLPGPFHPWTMEVALRAPALSDSAGDVALTDGFFLEMALSRSAGTERRSLSDLSDRATPGGGEGGPAASDIRAVLRSATAGALPELPAALGESGPLPDRVPLTVAQAVRFLEGALLPLANLGVQVAVPGWWRKDLARRVEVSARATPADGHSAMGLESIVSFQWEVAIGGHTLSADAFRKLVEARSPLMRLDDAWVRVSPQELAAALKLIGRRRGPASQALRLALEADPETAGPGLSVYLSSWLAELADSGRTGTLFAPARAVPPGLKGTLRPYQEIGYRWLAALADRGVGALLADDMGLGKTVQMIAVLLDRKDHRMSRGPTLLVCPTSVLTNWQRELWRFGPAISVVVRHGQGRTRAVLGGVSGGADVVLTSYALLWRDQAALKRVKWDGVVLDEAQAIKNPRGKAAAAARALDASYRVALTGTPVENRLADLWSLSAFLNPGYLGSLTAFRRGFARPVERDGDDARAGALRRMVAPLLLRRVKTDPAVARDLPERTEIEETCALSREQAALYQAQVDALEMRLGHAEGMERRALVATALTRLKQICNHPRHFLKDASPFTAARSGKLARFQEILDEALSEGDRVLVFTQYVELGELLRAHLGRRLGRVPPFLHGTVPRAERTRMVDAFQAGSEPGVFLLSLRAGGVGLNLTAASRVVHFDRWWNPAVEDQATDRAHRIGQTRRVMVHALTCAGTVEERIARLLREKRALAQRIVGSGEGWVTELDDQALLDLVRLGPEAEGA